MDDLGSPRLDPDRDASDPVPEPERADGISFVFTDKLPIVADPDSLAAESIRALRGVLLAQHLNEGRRSLAICSPALGAGSSFIAANLAVAMAQVGINTLLVDANLRDPTIQDYIVPSGPVIGLSECMDNDTLPMSSAVQVLQPSLSVLYAGTPDPSSHEKIGGNIFKSIMSSCLRDYDLTIVDTPPANRYADARRIASLARYALVVACCKRTYLKDIRTLLTELESDRTMAVGTYLNDY